MSACIGLCVFCDGVRNAHVLRFVLRLVAGIVRFGRRLHRLPRLPRLPGLSRLPRLLRLSRQSGKLRQIAIVSSTSSIGITEFSKLCHIRECRTAMCESVQRYSMRIEETAYEFSNLSESGPATRAYGHDHQCIPVNRMRIA
jgi:hypothetical protein